MALGEPLPRHAHSRGGHAIHAGGHAGLQRMPHTYRTLNTEASMWQAARAPVYSGAQVHVHVDTSRVRQRLMQGAKATA